MNKKINNDWALLIFSLVGIFILAPNLDRHDGLLVSLCFSMILILNSRMVWKPKYIAQYSIFIILDMFTYFILFNEHPWDFIFQGGLFESSAGPIIVCSLIMSLSGWLLLRNRSDRLKYLIITSGLQIPLALIVGTPGIESFLNRLSDMLGYYHFYSGAMQVWQLEWMLTYYLPIYFLNKKIINKK